ncbi:MAG: Na+/H+ antiporter subunit E [Nitriliruptoraceae bacterium]|nr:Na+/H+ antiporter subunit E [Nitriliruptoraceae bacterium]
MRSMRALALFLSLFAFWSALSGRLDPLFIVLGVLSAAGCTWLGVRTLESVIGPHDATPKVHLWHLFTFLVWLLTRIPPAGLSIARVVLDPTRPPRPGVVRFHTQLPGPAARTLLATAITVVPGTITVNVEGSEFTVHAFSPKAAEDLATAETQNRIARAFNAPSEPPPRMTWDPIHDELPEEVA